MKKADKIKNSTLRPAAMRYHFDQVIVDVRFLTKFADELMWPEKVIYRPVMSKNYAIGRNGQQQQLSLKPFTVTEWPCVSFLETEKNS